MSLQENIIRNDHYEEQIRVLLRARPNITTRAIAKATDIDKRLLNQILYYMPGARKNEDRIPKWSLVEAVPPTPRRRVLSSVALNAYMATHTHLPQLLQRDVGGVTYMYLPNENPDTAPYHNSDVEAREAREAIRQARETAAREEREAVARQAVATRQAREARETAARLNRAITAREAREAREAEEAEEAEDAGNPELICSSCGVTTDALLCCRAGALCSKCMDDIDPVSGRRRRDL